MICITIFAIVEGVLYLIEFLLLFIVMIMFPKNWKPVVRARMPTKTKSGVNKLEEQPFKSILPNRGRTIRRRKKKNAKGELVTEKEEDVVAIEALREDEELQDFLRPNYQTLPPIRGSPDRKDSRFGESGRKSPFPGDERSPRGRFDES